MTARAHEQIKSGTTTGVDNPTAAIREQEGSADELATLHSNSAPGRAFRDTHTHTLNVNVVHHFGCDRPTVEAREAKLQ